MKISIECPSEFQGNVMSSVNQRRGTIISSAEDGIFTAVEAEAPLAEMFGYATVLRSLTQGKAEFTMEFTKYLKVPKSLEDELIAKHKKYKQTRGKNGKIFKYKSFKNIGKIESEGIRER